MQIVNIFTYSAARRGSGVCSVGWDADGSWISRFTWRFAGLNRAIAHVYPGTSYPTLPPKQFINNRIFVKNQGS